jgi:hypothetical protein
VAQDVRKKTKERTEAAAHFSLSVKIAGVFRQKAGVSFIWLG